MSNLLQDFIIHFSEFRVNSINSRLDSLDSTEAETISIRDFARKKRNLSEIELRQHVALFLEEHVSRHNQKILVPQIFSPTGILTPEFINGFTQEARLNSIHRHPGRTFLAFLMTGLGVVGLALVGIFLYEAINATTFFSLLVTAIPFLTVLGPLGAILFSAVVLAIGALLICGAVVAITAKATTQEVSVTFVAGDQRYNASSAVPLSTLSHDRSDSSITPPVPTPPSSGSPLTRVEPPPLAAKTTLPGQSVPLR